MATTFDDALALAAEKFRGVTDSAGQPYILHCLRVTLAQSSDVARQVAVLHDVVEDTDVTLEELARRGFDREVIEGVDALTHRANESYQTYVLRIAVCPTARQVKIADLNDNYRLDRVKYRLDCQQADAYRLQKYILSYQFLTEQISQADYLSAMERIEATYVEATDGQRKRSASQ